MSRTQEIARLRAAETACAASAKLLDALASIELSVEKPKDCERIAKLANSAANALETWAMIKRGEREP